MPQDIFSSRSILHTILQWIHNGYLQDKRHRIQHKWLVANIAQWKLPKVSWNIVWLLEASWSILYLHLWSYLRLGSSKHFGVKFTLFWAKYYVCVENGFQEEAKSLQQLPWIIAIPLNSYLVWRGLLKKVHCCVRCTNLTIKINHYCL